MRFRKSGTGLLGLAEIQRVVSVITAALRPDPGYLLEALASLQAQLGDWEWLLQIDGADGVSLPAEILDEKRCLIDASGTQEGIPITKNRALERSGGSWVFALDADDFLIDGALDALVEALEDFPQAALAFGRARIRFEEEGTESVDLAPERHFVPGLIEPGSIERAWHAERRSPFIGGTCMWRREHLFAVGGWAAVPSSSDTVPVLAANTSRPVVYLPREVFVYRRHPAQITRSEHYGERRRVSFSFRHQRCQAIRELAGEAPAFDAPPESAPSLDSQLRPDPGQDA